MDKLILTIIIIIVIIIIIAIITKSKKNVNSRKKLQRKKLQSSRKQFKYNIYKEIDNNFAGKMSITNTNLLELTLFNSPKVSNFASKLQDEYGVGNIVWEVTKENDIDLAWEFYFYGMQKQLEPLQAKWQLFEGENNQHMQIQNFAKNSQKFLPGSKFDISNVKTEGLCIYSLKLSQSNVFDLNLFYVHENELALPLQLTQHVLQKNGFVKDTGVRRAFSTNCGQVLVSQGRRIGILEEDITTISNYLEELKYIYDNCIVYQGEDEIGVVLNGINTDHFINFLTKHHYDSILIGFVKEHKEEYNLVEKEVSLYFHKNTGKNSKKLIRTGFYGIL